MASIILLLSYNATAPAPGNQITPIPHLNLGSAAIFARHCLHLHLAKMEPGSAFHGSLPDMLLPWTILSRIGAMRLVLRRGNCSNAGRTAFSLSRISHLGRLVVSCEVSRGLASNMSTAMETGGNTQIQRRGTSYGRMPLPSFFESKALEAEFQLPSTRSKGKS